MSGINSGLIRLVCMTKNRSKEEGDAAEAAMIEDISLGLKDQIFTECLIDIRENDYRKNTYTLTRNGDLAGDSYFTCVFPEDASLPAADLWAILETVTWSFNGAVFERYDGRCLQMLAKLDPSLRPFVHRVSGGRQRVVFPLGSCFGKDAGVYLPLICMAFQDVIVHVGMADNWSRVAEEKMIKTTYQVLDTKERRALAKSSRSDDVTTKMSIHATHASSEPSSTARIHMDPVWNTDKNDNENRDVRDIMIMVRSRGAGAQDPVRSLRLKHKFSGKVDSDSESEFEHSVDPVDARSLIPRHYYDCDENARSSGRDDDGTITTCYFWPFDPIPRNRVSDKGWLRTGGSSGHDYFLELELEPGFHDIHVLTRMRRKFETSSGTSRFCDGFCPTFYRRTRRDELQQITVDFIFELDTFFFFLS
jgi:hypothetical protein